MESFLQKNINTLEEVQKFALRMCSKQWDQAYSQLFQLFNIATLSERRLYLDLRTMFKVVHRQFEFPPGILNTCGRTPSIDRPLLFHRPFARTNYYYNSFVPRIHSPYMDSLPVTLVSNSLPFLEVMYGCISHISIAILCILCWSP